MSQEDLPELQPPSLEDEAVCAYCWQPADIEVEGLLTQLSCTRCPARVTVHPDCLTMHKRTRCLSISTLTGFSCPRQLCKDPETWCNGKINGTHRVVRRKASKQLPPPMPKKQPQPKPAPNLNKNPNLVIVKQPKPKAEAKTVAPAPKPGLSVAARMGMLAQAPPSSGIIGDEPVEKPAPRTKQQPKLAAVQERSISPSGDDPDDIFRLRGSRPADRSPSPARVARYIMPQPFTEGPTTHPTTPPPAAPRPPPAPQRAVSSFYESFYEELSDTAYDADTAAAIAASLAEQPAIPASVFPPLSSQALPAYQFAAPQPLHQPALQPQQFPAPISFAPVLPQASLPPPAPQYASDAFVLPQPIAMYTPEAYKVSHPYVEQEEEEDDLVGELLALCGVSA